MILKVALCDPIKGRSSAEILVIEQQIDAQQAACSPRQKLGAHIVRMTKESVFVMATVSSAVMDTLMTLAPSNRLNSCLLSCHEPFRGQAEVITLRIGTNTNVI